MIAHAHLPPLALAGEVIHIALLDDPIPPFWFLVHQALYFDLDGAGLVIDGKPYRAPVSGTGFPHPAPRVEKPAGRAIFLFLNMGAFARLWGIDPARVTGSIAPLSHPDLDALHADLLAAGNDAARLALLDAHLLARHAAAPERDLPETALALLGEGAVPSVAALASRLGVTQRTLQRRFKARYGITPARYARGLRAFASVQQPGFPAISWAGVPPELDYADQSHWLKDLRDIFAIPPRRFLDNERYDWRYHARDGSPLPRPDHPDFTEFLAAQQAVRTADLARVPQPV